MINYFKQSRLKELISTAAIMLFCHLSYSQRVENVDFSVTNSKIVVSYDVTGCPSNQAYDVELYCSADNNFFAAKSITGALKRQSCGQNKIITWEVLNDKTELMGIVYMEVKIQPYTKLSGEFIFKSQALSYAPIFEDARLQTRKFMIPPDEYVYIIEELSNNMLSVYCKGNYGYMDKGMLKGSNRTMSTIKEVYMPKIPKPTAPANLEIKSISFTDKNGNNNNMLNANEKAEIGFTLLNSGKGNAYNLVAEIVKILNGPWEKYQQQKFEYPKQVQIGNLVSGGNTTVAIPISSTMNVESDTAVFEIRVKEGNGFDSDPVRISFNVQKFKNPLITISDYKFSTDGGKIKLGQLITLEIVLQNKGQGDASNISIAFINPQNVFPASETNFVIDKLRPNENRKFVYEFFANRMFTGKEIPIEVSVTESYNQYGDKRTLNVSLDQTLSQTQTITIAGYTEKAILIDNISLRSEVDTNIPVTGKTYNNRYALVIGNEDYKRYQTGLKSDQNVLFARNDATVFKEYLTKTMGVPEKQTFMLTDATHAQMNRELERITELAKLTPNAELIFYYAGHGLPDMETRQGYLIPVDVTASNLKDAISLKDLYSKLASSKAAKILVFLDACFSGGGRGENGLLAARTVKIKPKGDIVEGNIVAFTAASGEEVSLPLTKEYHGLFTYYVLRKLKDTQGKLTLEQLKDYLDGEIPKASLIENGMKQTPQVLTAPDLNNKWLSWKIQD